MRVSVCSVTGGELFEDIVAREYYSEADARYSMSSLSRRLLNVSFVAEKLHHESTNLFLFCESLPLYLIFCRQDGVLVVSDGSVRLFLSTPFILDPNDSGLLNMI